MLACHRAPVIVAYYQVGMQPKRIVPRDTQLGIPAFGPWIRAFVTVTLLLCQLVALGAEAESYAGENDRAADVDATVEVVRFSFDPSHVTVPPGATVQWTNLDIAPHTATGPDFDTGRLIRGDAVALRFDIPGTYAYACLYHANMYGVIVVPPN